MSIVKYLLTESGEVPSDIIDGGYLSYDSNLPWPQNYYLFGLASDPNNYEKFNSLEELINHVELISVDWKNIDESPYDISLICEAIWNKQN